ncbi:E3 ubiquitin-protein ligase ATL41-like [Macadamia integrifolia]|uniref:E3 ubiquitin-protein ligase ATL41-like n=1 Tax=Macadamia integrifolia TaxID=60698 RepID=UPI001C4EC610|nr:E3 ubiquitin-protein ligase ATL41-like [Macadamia integrifolia]
MALGGGLWFVSDNIIISGLTIIVAILFLLVLYRYVLCLSGSNYVTAIRGGANQPIESLEAAAGGQVQSRETPYTGLDPFIMATLPVYVYKQTDQLEKDGTRECVVCLSSFVNEEVAMLLPNCGHMFHSECINMWFTSHTTCPICRCPAEPWVVPEPMEKRIGWLSFTAIDIDFFNPITPNSEGTSDGSAQASEVGGLGSRLNSFERLIGEGWRHISEGIHPSDQTGGVEDPEGQ